MDSDFHFKITTESNTYDFDLRSTNTKSYNPQSSSRKSFVISDNGADTKTIEMFLEQALKNNPSSIEELTRNFKELPLISHVSICLIDRMYDVGIQTLGIKNLKRADSWLSKETKLKRSIAKKYWELRVKNDPNHNHEAFIGFIRSCSRYDPTVNIDDILAKALKESLKAAKENDFLVLFETLPLGIARTINYLEGLELIPPSPPPNPNRGPITTQ